MKSKAATFPSLVFGRGLWTPPWSVSLPSTLEKQVNEGLRALQGALLLGVLSFLLLLFFLLYLYGGVVTESYLLYRLTISFWYISLCFTFTWHSHLALWPGDGSAWPAKSQQHSSFGRQFLPFALLSTNHRVFEQSGPSQAASGVCPRSQR